MGGGGEGCRWRLVDIVIAAQAACLCVDTSMSTLLHPFFSLLHPTSLPPPPSHPSHLLPALHLLLSLPPPTLLHVSHPPPLLPPLLPYSLLPTPYSLAPLPNNPVAALVNLASNYLVSGQDAGRWGTAHPSIVPYQRFDTADGQMVRTIRARVKTME